MELSMLEKKNFTVEMLFTKLNDMGYTINDLYGKIISN